MNRFLHLLRQKITHLFPPAIRRFLRNMGDAGFWAIPTLSLIVLGIVIHFTIFSIFGSRAGQKLQPHLLFDSYYSGICRNPSANAWDDLISDRRWADIRNNSIIPFPLWPSVFKVNMPSMCVDRSKYMFEFLRIFNVDPHTDDLSTPRIFVIGAHTSIGSSIIRNLAISNTPYLFINSPSFLDFSNERFRRAISYVKIKQIIVCWTAPRYRFSREDDTSHVKSEDEAFASSISSWANSASIPITFIKLPTEEFVSPILTSRGASSISVPFHLDSTAYRDPTNVFSHSVAECLVSNTSIIDADPNSAIADITSDEIAKRILSNLPLNYNSVTVQKAATFLSDTLKCNVTFRNHKQIQRESVEIPFLNTFLKSFKRPNFDQPYASIVVVGRHDGFSAGFEKRTQNFLDALANNSIMSPLARFELVFVDYATPLEAGPLRSALSLLPGIKGKVRFIEVPLTAHVYLNKRLNSSVSFYEYIAKNIGVRRSRGKFILTTNPDDIISVDFISEIEREEFNDGILYRTNRYSGHEETESKHSATEIREALFNPWNIERMDVTSRCPSEIRGSTWMASVKDVVDDAWPCGAGDFLMLSKDMWSAIKGFNEYPGNANVDAVFLGKLMKFVPGYIRAIERSPIVHQWHPRKNIFRPAVREHEDIMKEYGCRADCAKMDKFQEEDDWGLGNMSFPEFAY